MFSASVCLLGISFLKVLHFLETLFFTIFSDFAKSVVEDACLINRVNADLIKVRDSRFYITVAVKGLLGVAEAWGNEWVEIREIEQFLKNVIAEKKHRNSFGVRYKLFLEYLEHYVFFHPGNLNKLRQQYYEIDYNLLETMLGKDLFHSTGSFKTEDDSLETAQRNNMDKMAEALQLGERGKRVMDIGCGWGGTAKYLAETYGASVIATTNSVKGYEAVRKSCAHLDVEPLLEDCDKQISPRDLDSAYALMLLMYIRSGRRRRFFLRVAEALKPKGLFFLQLIGTFEGTAPRVNGITNSIYEGASMVYFSELLKDIEGIFTVKSVEDVGRDEVLTKREWMKGFRENRVEWEKRLGKRYTCLVEMAQVGAKVAVELNEIQVWNIVLCKK